MSMSVVESSILDNALTLEELLEFENDARFLDFRCAVTGVLLWPAVRNQVIRLIISDLVYGDSPLIDIGSRRGAASIALTGLRTACRNGFRRPRRSSVLILATGAGMLERNNLFFNRFTDYFSEALEGETCTIEGVSGKILPLPRAVANVFFSTPAKTLLSLRARVAAASSKRYLEVASRLISLAEERAAKILGWNMSPERKNWLMQFCARQLASYPLRKKNFEEWVHKVRPRLLLVEEGCYGHMAITNATAHQMQLPVAEYQHGMVTRGHDAYNVAKILLNSADFRKTQPDYFLSYGAWWNNQFNSPVKRISIGNPHRSETIGELSSANKIAKKTILILGDGIETGLYLTFCRDLHAKLDLNFDVLFRPHPLEREHVLKLNKEHLGSLKVDHEPDIYVSLSKSDTVIGEVSTGLFEAVGLARRIFVWGTPKSRFGLPDHPFSSFKTAADLALMLSDPGKGSVSDEAMEAVWASDWQTRFKNFVDCVLIGCSPEETLARCR